MVVRLPQLSRRHRSSISWIFLLNEHLFSLAVL